MSKAAHICRATTKLGAPCKNNAQAGSKYCAVHRQLSAHKAETPLAATIGRANQVAEELRHSTPVYQPPPYSLYALLALLQQNAEQLADKVPVLGELRHNLEGTKPEDLVDPETWKGLWYILNCTTQAQSKQALDAVVERLARLPGGDALLMVKSTVEGASPKDFLDLETWKGAWIVVNAAVLAHTNDVKRRMLGEQDE